LIEYLQPFEGLVTPRPLAKYPDVVNNPMMGPSILFDGIPAYWNGSSDNNKVRNWFLIAILTEFCAVCQEGHPE